MGCLSCCRTLTKINQITPRYFKVTASAGFPELTVPLEVFPSPGLSSPDTAGTQIPQGKVSSFTHPSSLAAGKRPACSGPRERCRAQSEPEPAESTGMSWEQSGMATSSGSTKLTKAEKDLGAGGTVQPFQHALRERLPPRVHPCLGLHNPSGGIREQGTGITQLVCSIWAQHPREKHEDGLGLAALLLLNHPVLWHMEMEGLPLRNWQHPKTRVISSAQMKLHPPSAGSKCWEPSLKHRPGPCPLGLTGVRIRESPTVSLAVLPCEHQCHQTLL